MSIRVYPEYRDSGVPWLGSIPSHWGALPLKRLARLRTDHCASTDFQVALENIESGGVGRFVETESEFGTHGVGFSTGDVLFGKLRPYLAKIWVADRNGEAVGDFHVLRPVRDCNSRFLFYQLAGAQIIDVINGSTFGAKMPRASWDFMGQLCLARPPLPEQEEVAAFLDCETAKIDALVTEQERLIALLMEKRQALISHAVTKGLDPNAPMKDSGVEWLGRIPAHWVFKRLKFVARVQTGVAKGKDIAGRAVTEVPYLRVANVQDGYLDLDEVSTIEIEVDQLPRYRLMVGDVLMNEGGDYDKLGRGHVWHGQIDPCIHQNHVFAVRSFGVSPDWLNMFTCTSQAQFYFMTRSKQSTNLASISSANIMDLPVLVPPVSEQITVLDLLEVSLAKTDALMQVAYTSIRLLGERRSALISAAVTGKIDVRGLAA